MLKNYITYCSHRKTHIPFNIRARYVNNSYLDDTVAAVRRSAVHGDLDKAERER
jgi:hypothetical protein